MRINVYSQEIITELQKDSDCELIQKISNTGLIYSAVAMFLHSSERLHHPPADDDRSAVVFWLPKSRERREYLSQQLQRMAQLVMIAPDETGLD